MGAFVDLIGRQFGRLTVISMGPRRHGGYTWICRCQCKNVTPPIRSGELIGGHRRSCGCIRADSLRKARGANLAGRTFGRLTVLTQAGYRRRPSGDSVRRWLCICDHDGFGQPKTVTCESKELLRGHCLSCGCLAKDRVAERNRARRRTINVFGIHMSVGELAALLGIPENTMRQRIARGLSLAEVMKAGTT
jgi:hypothetical protein